MTNPIKICSNALMMLGAKPIASFSESEGMGSNLDRAKLCAGLYPGLRLAILRGHYWNTCARRVLLSPDGQKPAFGYAYRFLLPGDWLRTWGVGDRYTRGRLDYRSEGRYLLCNEPVLPLLYGADVPEDQWDTLLVDVMTLAVAARLAYPITASTSVEEAKKIELRDLLREARATDGQDDPPETFGDFPLLQSRMRG
jgi:hypothetical protein